MIGPQQRNTCLGTTASMGIRSQHIHDDRAAQVSRTCSGQPQVGVLGEHCTYPLTCCPSCLTVLQVRPELRRAVGFQGYISGSHTCFDTKPVLLMHGCDVRRSQFLYKSLKNGIVLSIFPYFQQTMEIILLPGLICQLYKCYFLLTLEHVIQY